MFENARIKLTAWYLAIIMVISLLFSFGIYSMINNEFHRFERLRVFIREDQDIHPYIQTFQAPRERIDPTFIQESRRRLIVSLVSVNILIFVLAGGAGYFLAGRTLRPIKEMVDEQNRFVSDSSHELRTPLTSLRSEIEVALRNKRLGLTDAKEVLKSNLEEVMSLQTLSDRLLELAQNGESLNQVSMQKVSLSNVVQDAIKKVSASAKAKQIKIENSAQDSKVLGIPDRLTEVFVILLDNAIKYSKVKGKVEIESKKTDGKIEVSLTDYGAGISKEDLPHIFDRFYRSDKSRTEKGFGLGLSIAKKIIEGHGGEITVESKPDKKTTFTVSLPHR